MRTPCQDDPELWVSDFPELRVEAVKGCAACPVLAECRAGMFGRPGAGDFGVWAGVDYSRESVTAPPAPPAAAPEPKWCQRCGDSFTKKRNTSREEFERARFCSRACANKSRGKEAAA